MYGSQGSPDVGHETREIRDTLALLMGHHRLQFNFTFTNIAINTF